MPSRSTVPLTMPSSRCSSTAAPTNTTSTRAAAAIRANFSGRFIGGGFGVERGGRFDCWPAGGGQSRMPLLRRIALAVFALLLASPPAASGERLTADGLLLVVNHREPESRRVAEYYADKRGVPDGRILELDVEPKDEIARDAYDRDVAAAVRKWLADNDPAGTVRCVVPCYGVPLRVGSRQLTEAEQASGAGGDRRAGRRGHRAGRAARRPHRCADQDDRRRGSGRVAVPVAAANAGRADRGRRAADRPAVAADHRKRAGDAAAADRGGAGGAEPAARRRRAKARRGGSGRRSCGR